MRHSRILAFKHPKPRPNGNGSVSAARNSPPQGRGNVLVAHKYITSTPSQNRTNAKKDSFFFSAPISYYSSLITHIPKYRILPPFKQPAFQMT